jgi:hypothetical protein
LIGGAVNLFTVFFCSFLTTKTMFIYLYGLGLGFGKGFMYAPPLAAAWSHLPGRKGTASGIIISGYGFGGFIFGNISHHLCNPDNIKVMPYTDALGHKMNLFPNEVAMNVPYMLRSLGTMWLCLFAFGLLVISKYEGQAYSEHENA